MFVRFSRALECSAEELKRKRKNDREEKKRSLTHRTFPRAGQIFLAWQGA